MKRKSFYLFLFIILLSALSLILLWKSKLEKQPKINMRQVTFDALPGWKQANPKKSLSAFQLSCKTFLKQDPNRFVGSEYIHLQAKDWYPICQEALALKATSDEQIKNFFQKWFVPVTFFDKKPLPGLFTGYYMPLLQGNKKQTKTFNVPLYGVPKDLMTIDLSLFDPKFRNQILVGRVKGNKILPYYTRAEINKGAIKEVAPVIAWLNNSVDRSFLEIQGSGVIKLTDGTQLAVNYAAENGKPYTSIAKVLIDKGVMTKDNASMQHIRSYLAAHPEQLNPVLNQNKSFVFFNVLPQEMALGSQGVALTPGYSLAIDRKWVPLGMPVWLNTTRPAEKSAEQQTFQRLMIAQDTGGAIKGAVRGDVYWGAGEQATSIAGRMKNKGHYWLLVPKEALAKPQNSELFLE